MTVIFSNYLDNDCQILKYLWKGFDNVNLVEILPSSENYEDIVDKAISEEEDTLIICGHGTSNGLLFPDIYKGEYIIHENNIHLIKAKRVVCIWCYASGFCMNFPELNCFATSMFISNEYEAVENGIIEYSQEEIDSTGERFFTEVNYLLKDNVPLNKWVMRLGAHMDIENSIDIFNRQGLFYQ